MPKNANPELKFFSTYPTFVYTFVTDCLVPEQVNKKKTSPVQQMNVGEVFLNTLLTFVRNLLGSKAVVGLLGAFIVCHRNMSERLGPLEFLGRVEDVDGDSCHSFLREFYTLGCSSPNIHQHMNVVFFSRESF